jgi:REP element-mobilizing transposase RayT
MRKPRIEFPGGFYHVIARGNQRQNVFWDDGDRVRYLKLLGKYLEACRFVLYAYCLMNNHVHLLIEQNDEYPLSKYMQRLQSAYTNFFNRKHGKVGHLFQGRYKSILVDKDSYLVELVRYIHLNPHRAGLENADKYPWTSHRQYLGKDQYPLAPVKADKVLSVFSKMKPMARRKYLAYVMEKRKDGKRNEFYDLRDGRILGDEGFEEEVHEKAGLKKQELTLKLNFELGNLWKAICKRDGCAKEPKGWTRSRMMAEAAYLAMEGMNVRQIKVAEYFGVEASAVNMALKRLAARWEKGDGSKEALVAWSKGLKDCEF